MTGRLRGGPCEFLGSDLKIKTADDHVRYSDVFVVCSRVDNASTIVTDPVVIFEVLSPSTAANDRIVKAREYQAMPSVRRTVMLEQDRIGATIYVRASQAWTLEILIEDALLALPEIGVVLPLAELYEGIAFGDAPGADAPLARDPRAETRGGEDRRAAPGEGQERRGGGS